jgi:mycothiol synthase
METAKHGAIRPDEHKGGCPRAAAMRYASGRTCSRPHEVVVSELTTLRMRFTQFEDLVPPELPEGYRFRSFRLGDEDAWLDLLAAAGIGGWGRDRLDALLAGGDVEVPVDGIIFVTHEEAFVATACVLLHPREEGSGYVPELALVAVRPRHRVQHLGLQVCRAALMFIRELSHGYVYLVTEEERLPAIRTFLEVGFEPEPEDDGESERWQRVQGALEAT